MTTCRTTWFHGALVFMALMMGAAADIAAQNLDWAKRAGGTSPEYGSGIATDSAGNSYVTGHFYGTTTFGAGEANETTLTVAGNSIFGDIFIAKYAASGALVWAKRAGSPGIISDAGLTGSDSGEDIATDSAGNSYVTGVFSGTATFGAGEVNETTLTSVGSQDIFIAKYAASGTLVWATRAGGTNPIGDEGFGIATDSAGNSYVTGHFFRTATFGAGEAQEITLTAAGSNDNSGDIFVAKYAASGTLVWATRAGGIRSDAGGCIATDRDGNSYVTGWFADTATFGAGEANETTLTAPGSTGGRDIFIAKYAASGTLVWVKHAGGTGSEDGFGIAIDSAGNSYVTGWFTGTATFGAGEVNQTTLTAAGSQDIFVAKYDASGALVWATRAGGTSSEKGSGIAIDSAGNSYVAGWFTGTATFGAGEVNQTTLTAVHPHPDIFVAKFSAVVDTDGDDIPDDDDACPTSDLSDTVVIDGCDSGVNNTLFVGDEDFGNGCTIADLIMEIVADATNHGQFVSSVAHLTNDLKKVGIISGSEKGIIQSCASQSSMP